MPWDPSVIERNQIVLFAERLDEVLPQDHCVRRLVKVLLQLEWSNWEGEYQHDGSGRRLIHPRVMCGIVLYGLMRGIRASRQKAYPQ
jgi:transposase